jgi:hypothetical protein
MDLAQNFIFDLGWVFFTAWGLVLVTLSVIAFRQDLLPATEHDARQTERR